MSASAGQHSDGAEPLLPPQQERAYAPDQPSPPRGGGVIRDPRSGSVEGVATHGPVSPTRPLPMAPIDTQGAFTGAPSPTFGRYPAPLSPTGISYPVSPSNRAGGGGPGDPFQSPGGESSSRPPSGGRNGSRHITSGVYAQSAEGAHPQGPGGIEADITDHASHAGMHSEGGPAGGVRVLPTRRQTAQGQGQGRPTASVEDEKNALEWIVPNVRDSNAMLSGRGVSMMEKRFTVRERLQKTHDAALIEQKKYETRAKQAALIINLVTYLQIISNALITGLSAATTNRHAQIGVSALGAINTLISSFLVRVRASREPERSKAHAQNLEKYIRDLEAFMDDEGGSYDRKWDPDVKKYRVDFDKLQTAQHQAENGQPVSDTSSTTSQTPTTSTTTAATGQSGNTAQSGFNLSSLGKMV